MAGAAFVGATGALRLAPARSTASSSLSTSRPAYSRRTHSLRMMAAEPGTKELIKVVDISGDEFVVRDPKTGRNVQLTLRQKEELFIDAAYSYYAGKPLLDNEAFDTLKEFLTWQGSNIVNMSRDELTFLEAARAYAENKPIMSDDEYDALKKKLLDTKSSVALQLEPRCSIVSQTCWSDCVEDRTRQTVLYLPAAGIGALIWATISFEFTPLRNMTPILSLLTGIPFIVLFARIATEIVLPNPLILVGKCPSCGTDQRVYFGNIATIEGYKDTADVQCTKCQANLSLSRDKRRFRLDTSFKAPPKAAPKVPPPKPKAEDKADE